MQYNPRNKPIFILAISLAMVMAVLASNYFKPDKLQLRKPSAGDAADLELQDTANRKIAGAIAAYKNEFENNQATPQEKYFHQERSSPSGTGTDKPTKKPLIKAPGPKKVEAIIYSQIGAVAIINGKAMKEGESFKSGERIISITEDWVTLMDKRGKSTSISTEKPFTNTNGIYIKKGELNE